MTYLVLRFREEDFDNFAVLLVEPFSAKHSTESFGTVSAVARENITAVFTEVGYADNWISFGLSKVGFVLDDE